MGAARSAQQDTPMMQAGFSTALCQAMNDAETQVNLHCCHSEL